MEIRMSSSFCLLLLSTICSFADALPHSGPDPTVSYKPADWNPRPTTTPKSQPELFKRDGSNASICGWYGGNVNQPVACPSDSKCVYDTNHGMVGCCPLSGPCSTGVYTTCVGGAQGAQNPSILTCSAGSVCYQNLFPGGYSQYACGSSAVTNSIATSYSGQSWASQLQVIYTQLTLATTQSTSSTSSSTTATTSSSSSTSSSDAPSSTTSRTSSLTTKGATSQTSATTSLPTEAQAAASSSVASDTATVLDPQTKAGIIAGSVIGSVGVIFAILALGCGLMRRRQRKKANERSTSIVIPKEKTMSISSYASSQLSGHTRIHPFSPDDIISPMTPPEQPQTSINATEGTEVSQEVSQEPSHSVELDEPYLEPPQLIDIPNPRPLPKVEEPYVRRVQLFDRPSIDELADLPPPWVRAPTPPPRSPKRPIARKQQPEALSPLEIYLQSPDVPIRPSVSVTSNTSDTSRYSRTTDGRSVRSIRDNRSNYGNEEEVPPMPVMRKPVGSGWYRTMPQLAERKLDEHVAFQLSDKEDVGRSLISTQQPLERSISEPVRNSMTEEAVERYAGMSATVYNVQELDIRGLTSDWVAPLRLNAGVQDTVVKKQRSEPVPILGIPAAPSPGGRGRRLYDVPR